MWFKGDLELLEAEVKVGFLYSSTVRKLWLPYLILTGHEDSRDSETLCHTFLLRRLYIRVSKLARYLLGLAITSLRAPLGFAYRVLMSRQTCLINIVDCHLSIYKIYVFKSHPTLKYIYSQNRTSTLQYKYTYVNIKHKNYQQF